MGAGIEVDEPVEATSERVLDSALEMFELVGLRRTTVEDVARRARVSRVTVYRRFGSKEGMAQAVLLREERRFLDELDRALAGEGSVDQRLAEGFAFALDYLRGHPLLQRLLATEPETFLPYLTVHGAPVMEAARNFVARLLETEIRQGRLPRVDADVAAELGARLVISLLLNPASVAPLGNREDARRFATRYLVPALLDGGRRR